MWYSSNLLNAALKAKNLTNSSQGRKYSNCMSIDLKLGNLPPTIQRTVNMVFPIVVIILENLKGIVP